MVELIKKGKAGPATFIVLRSFPYGGQVLEVGAPVELREPEATGLVKIKKTFPNWPDVIECIALADLTFPGRTSKFEAKKNEKILVKAEDALPLMFDRLIVPVDDSLWRPFGLRLKRR